MKHSIRIVNLVFFLLLLYTAVLVSGSAGVLATSDAAASHGSFSGNAQAVTEEGKLIGYKLAGEVHFSEENLLDGFSSNFIVPEGDSRASVILKAKDETVAALTFEFGQETFAGSATFSAGAEIRFEAIAYREGREVQYRIGREQRVSIEDGSVDYIWTFRVNTFSQRFLPGDPVADTLSKQEANAVTYAAEVSPSAVVQVIGETMLYDYPVLEDKVSLRANTLSFERFDFLWQTPEGYGQKGFIIRRYCDGKLDDTITITSSSVGSLSQNRMKQGTTYTYKIYGYDDTNVATTPCPKVLFQFADFSVTTRAGSLAAAIGVIVGILLILAAVIILYTFRYQLPIRRKVHESAQKKN